MSVIVKGMEMPKGSCEWIGENGSLRRCKLLNGDDDCKMQEGICADATWEEQFSGCPLVEIPTPHGRLIDATFEENHYASMLLDPTPDVTVEDRKKAKAIIDALHMARTVIEAEGETDGR